MILGQNIETLRKLNKNNVEMLIPKFEDNFLKVMLTDEGFHVNEIEALEKVALDNSLKLNLFFSHGFSRVALYFCISFDVGGKIGVTKDSSK